MLSASAGQRDPSGSAKGLVPGLSQEPTTVAVPSGSNRDTAVVSASSTCPVSAATEANTSDGETPRATSVATRRKAACSSATRRSSSRLDSSESAMVLKDCSRPPTSPGPVSGIRTVRSPPATWPAIAEARRNGRTIERVR